MQPNQPPQYQPPYNPQVPQQGQPTSLDYLNQISSGPAPKPKGPFGSLKRIILFAALAVVGILIIISVSALITDARKAPLERLGAQFPAAQEIADNAQTNIKSGQLRGLNTDLRLFFTNASRDLTAPLATNGVTLGKVSGRVGAEEAATTEATVQRLEDARLNAVFDRTYAREMTYQIATLLALMKQVYTQTGNQELKTTLQDAYNSLLPLHENFSDFNEDA